MKRGERINIGIKPCPSLERSSKAIRKHNISVRRENEF